MSRILLVDDDPGIREALSLALTSLGHDVDTAPDGTQALSTLSSGAYDVVLLDVMMPGIDGFETCRRIRERSHIPVLMLTARSDAIDIVVGLECGADDYVAKPVEPRVLDARIKAILRRLGPAPAAAEPSGRLVVDEPAAKAWRDGQLLDLTAMEFRLLAVLMRNEGIALSRSKLLELVWDYAYEGDSRLVDATMQRLRAKVEPVPSQPIWLQTVRGIGYRLDVS